MLLLCAERVNARDIRERFVWYEAPGKLTTDRSKAHRFPDVDSLRSTARAIDARGGWTGFVNVAAQEASCADPSTN